MFALFNKIICAILRFLHLFDPLKFILLFSFILFCSVCWDSVEQHPIAYSVHAGGGEIVRGLGPVANCLLLGYFRANFRNLEGCTPFH